MFKRQDQSNNFLPIAVLGAGSWGTALAQLIAVNGRIVHLWTPNKEDADHIKEKRCNDHYLPEVNLSANIIVSHDLTQILDQIDDVFIAVPSLAFLETMIKLKPLLSERARVAWGTKGLDPHSNHLLHEVVGDTLQRNLPIAVLSGPTFALEVAKGLPTAVCLASTNEAFAQALCQTFANPHFRVYLSTDMIGVQICGAVKNVLAIATGISDGMGYGTNARCALITRGLAEMMRLGIKMGAKQETFMGLAGIGDLVLTCTDNQSRNRRFGLALAQGVNSDEAEKSLGQVVEGRHNAAQIYQLAQTNNVEMPIIEQVYQVVERGLSPQQAVAALLNRPSN